MSYAKEQLYQALHSLIIGEESLRKRLVSVCTYHLAPLELHQIDIPDEIKAEFLQFMNDISRFEAEGDKGTFHATVYKIDEDEVVRMVERIISMYEVVIKLEL